LGQLFPSLSHLLQLFANDRMEPSVPYRGIQRHTGGIVRLFSKRFPCLDQFDAVMSELQRQRFAVAAFRPLERPLVMIWIVSRIDPRKKQRHAADKASTFSDW